MLSLPMDTIEKYWQTLYMHDYLRFRLGWYEHPTWAEVKDMISRMGKSMFAVCNPQAEIRGEFMLENFTGYAAMIHYSVHPENTGRENIYLVRWCSEQIFTWGVKTLYGLISENNRASRLMAKKAGFTLLGVLPNSIKDQTKVVDGYLFYKESSSVGG